MGICTCLKCVCRTESRPAALCLSWDGLSQVGELRFELFEPLRKLRHPTGVSCTVEELVLLQ